MKTKNAGSQERLASHTPGPWVARLNHFSRWEILDARGVLAMVSRHDDPASPPPITETEANARRIVACVNACAGISTEALEAAATDKTHGCHADLEEDQKPDACVLDWEGGEQDCLYAKRLKKNGETKIACEYWRPIALKFRLSERRSTASDGPEPSPKR